MNPFSHTLLVGTVFLLTLEELTEACSCISFHPQAIFCKASVVIRAKVISKQFVEPNRERGDSKVIYGIQLIEAFKGVDKNNTIDSAYTSSQSSMCGVRLNVDNQEYLLSVASCSHGPVGLTFAWRLGSCYVVSFLMVLITTIYLLLYTCCPGYLQENKLSIGLCGLAIPWNQVTAFQMRGIKGLYQIGCACKITDCYREPCDTRALDQCDLNEDGSQNLACIQQNDGSCMWNPTSPSYRNSP